MSAENDPVERRVADFATVAMLIFPWVWAVIVVPDLFGVLTASPSAAIWGGILFGFLWGIGGIMFGISVPYIGMALTYGIVFSNFMSKGVFTFRGGTDRLIGMMDEELRRGGVIIAEHVELPFPFDFVRRLDTSGS